MRIFIKPLALATVFTLYGGVGAWAQTELTLAATGSAIVAPDQSVAALDVQASAPLAATAQAAVNRSMANALAAARAVGGLTATTGDYSVYRTDPQTPRDPAIYQASQTVNLTIAAPGGVPPPDFAALIGRLQQNGLLLDSLGGQLSVKGQDAAEAAATQDAIHRLQSEASAVAVALGVRVGAMKSLSVDNTGATDVVPGRMMMMKPEAAAPPQAAPGPVSVQASVSAVIELSSPGP